MGIRLPKIQPIASAAPARNPRINVNVKSQAGAILKKTQGISSLAKDVGDAVVSYEDDKINQISNDLGKQYKAWDNQQLQSLAKISPEIDPTKAYNDYDIAKSKKHEELIAKYPDLNERVRTNVESNLARTQESYENRGLKQRGLQETVYANNLHVATLKISRENLADDAANVTADGKSNFDTTLRNISTEIAKNGLSNSTSKRLPDDAKSWDYDYLGSDGKMVKISLTKPAKLKIAQQQGEGIAFAIKSAIDSGQKDQAKIVYEKYGKQLDTKNNNEIIKKFGKVNLRDQSYKLAAEIQTKPRGEQEANLRKITNPELRSKVRANMVAENAQIAKLRDQREQKFGDEYLDRLDALKKAGKANSYVDLEKDPVLEALGEKTSRKFMKSVEQSYNSAVVDNSEDVVKAQEVILGNVSNVSRAKFEENITSRMKDSTKNSLRRQFMSKKQKPSDSFKTVDKAKDVLRNLMFQEDLLTYKEGKKLTDASYKREQAAYGGLINYLEDIPGNVSPKDLSEHMEDYITKAKKQKLFGIGSLWDDNPGDFSKISKARVEPLSRNEILNGLEEDDFRRLKMKYKNQSGAFVNKKMKDLDIKRDKDLLNFIADERGL